MAKFYPAVSKDFHGSTGEQMVYKSLSSLGDEYIVFHSYRWLGGYGQRRSEGEADFIVVHPKLGILVIEVKSGGIRYCEGSWMQKNLITGEERRIDPLGQAAESQYRIQRLLKKLRFNPPLIGRAVWFTAVRLSPGMQLPAEASPAIVLDVAALDEPEAALGRAYSYWAKNVHHSFEKLNAAQLKAVMALLLPELELVPTISGEAREAELSLVQLTERQSTLLHFLREQPMAAIHGPAGTGKTLLAVEKARMLAADGQRVLYLCFNELLLSHLRSREESPLITFHNVRTLGQELMGNSSLPPAMVVPAFEQFFAAEYDDDEWPYPNVVVDEGQDISDSVLSHLAFLAEYNDGIFYAFYDRNQYIMSMNRPKWLDENADCRLVLYKNCRNTTEIAATAGGLLDMKRGLYANDVHGRKPKAVFCPDKTAVRKAAEDFVRGMKKQGLKYEELAILTVRGTEVSALSGVKELAGVPVSFEQAAGKVLFTSVRKFKGLEAKAVLLVDMPVSRLAVELWQRLFYVGCTRALAYLKVAFWEDIEPEEYSELLEQLGAEDTDGGREELLKLLSLEEEK